MKDSERVYLLDSITAEMASAQDEYVQKLKRLRERAYNRKLVLSGALIDAINLGHDYSSIINQINYSKQLIEMITDRLAMMGIGKKEDAT